MEEVDSIILHYLRQLNIDIGNDVKKISDLPVEVILESATKCISAINRKLKVPIRLPSGVSQRIEVATQIASICKDLGYQYNVGYQTFLYHNETELRQVFMFLIEKLSSADKAQAAKVQPVTKIHKLFKRISSKIAEEFNTIWALLCCKPSIQSTTGDFMYNKGYPVAVTLSSEEKLNESRNIKTKSTGEQKLFCPPEFKTDPSVEIDKYECVKSLKELREQTISLQLNLDTHKSERNLMNVELSQAQKDELESYGIDVIEQVYQELSELHKTLEIFKSMHLTQKLRVEKLKSLYSLSESNRTKYKNNLVNLKESAKAMKGECEKKGEWGGNDRAIMEVMRNVDEKNAGLKNIIEDTRQLQKKINTFEGLVKKCFTIASFLKDAKRVDQAKRAYKLLDLLQSECNTILTLVNNTVPLCRDIVELEDKLEAESSETTEDTLTKTQSDVANHQQENE